MAKIFWLDTETSGVNAEKNALLQLAYIIEIDGVVVAQSVIHMRPWEGATIEKKALDVNQLDAQGIWLAPPLQKGVSDLQAVLAKYVSRYDKTDKFIQAGYNVGFDDKFLRQAFIKAGDDYYGSWFFWPKLDVSSSVAQWMMESKAFEPPKNFQLATMCGLFNVPIKAHDAASDINATRELYYKLLSVGKPMESGV